MCNKIISDLKYLSRTFRNQDPKICEFQLGVSRSLCNPPIIQKS